MIDFSEIEAYYGPLSVEDLDAAVAAVLNPDTTPDATHETALITSAAVANQILSFDSVTVSATTGDIVSISDDAITADYVLLSFECASPASITTNLTWTSAAGSFVVNGTCATATTAKITIGRKGN